MSDDIIETLLKHHGEIKRLSARIERLESRDATETQHEIAEQAAEIERYRKLEQKPQLGEIERLCAKIERLESRGINDMQHEIAEQAAEVERLRAALDEIAHYWSGGPIDPGWKEIARRALEES